MASSACKPRIAGLPIVELPAARLPPVALKRAHLGRERLAFFPERPRLALVAAQLGFLLRDQAGSGNLEAAFPDDDHEPGVFLGLGLQRGVDLGQPGRVPLDGRGRLALAAPVVVVARRVLLLAVVDLLLDRANLLALVLDVAEAPVDQTLDADGPVLEGDADAEHQAQHDEQPQQDVAVIAERACQIDAHQLDGRERHHRRGDEPVEEVIGRAVAEGDAEG